MSGHNMTVEWDGYSYRPQYHLGCTEPPEALCRADCECECEEAGRGGVDENGPWHELASSYMTTEQERQVREGGPAPRHYGKPGGECTLALWINNADDQDELGHGSVTFPVDVEWNCGEYTWSPS